MDIKARNRTFFRFLCLVFLPVLSYSQTDTLLQGQLVKDGEDLVSAFGNFRLGFFSPRSTTKRYLGIWYHRPIDRVDPYYNQYYYYGSEGPAWVANRNTPILDNESASLTIDSTDGNLKILRNGGNPIAVSSVQAKGNTSATLLKNGNFVLYKMNSDGSKKQVLWQSFDYPTDTLLPGMKLGIDLQTGHQWFLRSWISPQSPAEGSYVLGMDLNITNKLVIWKGGKVHWTSQLMLNESLNLPIPGAKMYNFSYTSNERERYLNFSENEDVTSFPEVKIGTDGELVDDMRRSILCTIFGGCRNDGCWRTDDQFQVKYGFMDGVGFKFNGSAPMTWSDCRAKCLNNCSCVAFASTNKYNYTGCQIWSRRIKFVESNKNEYGQIFLVVDPKDAEKKWWLLLIIVGVMALMACLLLSLGYLTRRKYKAREEKQWMSFAVVLGATLVVPLLCYVCYLLLKKLEAKVQSIMNRKKLLRELEDNVSCPTRFGDRNAQAKARSMKHELNIFDFQTIATATNNFSATNRLGQGGFGAVYKGKLVDGQDIGIKRLSKTSGQGIREFKNEAKLIAKLQHTNLVRLLGCSLKGDERLLVYEYMPNKSLDFFIFDSTRKRLLNWEKRFNIIEGIAQGLLYLHKYSRLRVIHRDLKASNILLDDQMTPKISDFGMARTFAMNELEANTNRIVGTHGYMSPEYVMHGIVSMKSDVYSFGVLVLEIISSKKNNSSYDTERPLNLVGYAWQLWNDGKGLELIDPTVDDSCSDNEVLRCIHVGLLCVQDRATDRPTMSDVISMLTNDTMVLPAPKQPAFYINIPSDLEPEVTAIKLEIYSANDLTISEIEGR